MFLCRFECQTYTYNFVLFSAAEWMHEYWWALHRLAKAVCVCFIVRRYDRLRLVKSTLHGSF